MLLAFYSRACVHDFYDDGIIEKNKILEGFANRSFKLITFYWKCKLTFFID